MREVGKILEELKFEKSRIPAGDESLADSFLTNTGLLLVIVGFLLALVAAIFLAVKSRGSSSQTRSAGILLIGPIPIIFGSDRNSVRTLMILAIIFIAFVLAFMVIPSLILSR
jgi:uncharacterized protein (TIGR00304 family)